MIQIKSKQEIQAMRRAGLIVAELFEKLRDYIRPGISTGDIDSFCQRHIEGAGAICAFHNYGEPPFPGHVCVSVEDEVVHGIGRPGRILREGEIVSVDVGALLDGWYSDACRSYAVGQISAGKQALMDCCERAFWKGFEQCREGLRLGDAQWAVQREIEACSYGIVRELTGHGLGRGLHEDPSIPNYGRAGHGPRLKVGMVLCIEPMITLGDEAIYVADDDWTILTQDGSVAAHYENTIAITEDGPISLTSL